MNLNEFLSKAKELVKVKVPVEHPCYNSWAPDYFPVESEFISIEWCIAKGGEHWRKDYEPEEEPEFEPLDQILEKVCPNITYLQYKKVIRIAQSHEYETGGYYEMGKYIMKSIRLDQLFDKLVELKLIED